MADPKITPFDETPKENKSTKLQLPKPTLSSTKLNIKLQEIKQKNMLHINSPFKSTQNKFLRQQTIKSDSGICKKKVKQHNLRNILTNVPSFTLLPDDKFKHVWNIICLMYSYYKTHHLLRNHYTLPNFIF